MSDILTPNFGESVTSATVAAWHKNAGDPVAKGDTLVKPCPFPASPAYRL